MGFFGMVIKAGEKEIVEVPPGWCLQLCTAAFEPPKGTKLQQSSASLWLQVEGEIGDTSFLIGTLQGGGSCAQITVRHCLTSVDGEVVVEAKGAGFIHLTGFFDRDFNDGGDSACCKLYGEGEEEEEDSDEMPSLDALAILKRGMRRKHKRDQDEDDDDNDESDDDDEPEDDGGGEEEEDESKQISALRNELGPKRSAAVAAVHAFATAKATGNRQGKGGDLSIDEDSEEDDDDYVPGEEERESDEGMEEEDTEEQEDDDGDSEKDDGDEKEGKADGREEPRGGGKNGKPMGVKRRPSDGLAQASSAPAVKRSRIGEEEDEEEAAERSKAVEEEEQRKMTKQERKNLRKKENKRKATEAKRELEEAFSASKNDKEPPVGVPLKSPRTKTLKGGLKIKDTVLGGGKVAVVGKNVKICYEGCFPDGRVFDKKLSRKRPLQFRLGLKQVIVGMDKGVEGMRVGGSREIAIPSGLGYGARGTGPIPPNQDLMFRVELIDVLGK